MASVLIVDDSLVMRRNLTSILSQAGYQVIDEAVTGNEAIEMYRKHRPDFVTMDINMPGTNGLNATLKILEEFPKARIIIITSIDEKEMVVRAIKSGAKYYIIKPVTYEKVLAVMNTIGKE